MELEGFAFDDNYPQAREALREAVNNLDYMEYALHEGPLQISQLVASARKDPEVERVIAEYGWPSLREDSIIEPVQAFSTDKEFIDSLRPDGEFGRQMLISSDFSTLLLVASPDNRAASHYITASELGKLPVIHRAYAVAPDLFESLRVVLGEFKTRYSYPRPVDDEDRIYDAIVREENGDISQAMHMAYRILGRLLKVSDRRESHLDSTATPARPILNADEVLRYNAW